MEKTTKKVISTNYTVNTNYPKVNFELDRFKQTILDKGYNVYHEKALKCPCINDGTNSPLPSCENCNGVGWFFVEKKKTKMLVQNMNFGKKYDSWSEQNVGTSQITSLAEDDISYMDRITLIDLESDFSQKLNFVSCGGKIFSFTIYQPIIVKDVYRFVSTSSPLVKLVNYEDDSVNYDFKVEANKVILNPLKYTSEIKATIRYKYQPMYCIIDLQRESFKTNDAGCSTVCEDENNDIWKSVPKKSIGKRLHYIWDAPNLEGESVNDNTDYSQFPTNLLD